MPHTLAMLEKNGHEIIENLSLGLRTIIDELPGNPNYYPGGLENILSVFEQVHSYLKDTAKSIEKLSAFLQANADQVEKEYERNQKDLQGIFDHAPKIPWTFRIFPPYARDWAVPIFYGLRYAKQILQAQSLKESCIKFLQAKIANKLELEALSHLTKLVTQLTAISEQGKVDFLTFKETVLDASRKITSGGQESPIGQKENGFDENFRISAVESCFSEWAYQNWRPPLERLVHDLIDEAEIFRNWRSITAHSIVEPLTTYGEKTFTPLWEICLDDLFGLWAENTPGFVLERPLTPAMISKSILAAYPLLKPDFDAAGGSGISNISGHNFIGQPEWQFCKITSANSNSNRRETIYTGDPYTCIFIEVRHSVSLNALTELVHPGKNGILSLSAAEKSALELIPGLAVKSQAASGDLENPIQPDEGK